MTAVMAATEEAVGTEVMAVTVAQAGKGAKAEKEVPEDMTDAMEKMAESLPGQHY